MQHKRQLEDLLESGKRLIADEETEYEGTFRDYCSFLIEMRTFILNSSECSAEIKKLAEEIEGFRTGLLFSLRNLFRSRYNYKPEGKNSWTKGQINTYILSNNEIVKKMIALTSDTHP